MVTGFRLLRLQDKCEEEQHVGGIASAQTPVPDGLQHLYADAFRDLPYDHRRLSLSLYHAFSIPDLVENKLICLSMGVDCLDPWGVGEREGSRTEICISVGFLASYQIFYRKQKKRGKRFLFSIKLGHSPMIIWIIHSSPKIHCCSAHPACLFHFRCDEENHVATPASAQTLQQPHFWSLKDWLDTTTLEEPSITATSLSSPQDTIEVSPPSGRCLLSSSIRLREEREWGLTFYIRVDLGGSFHTYPHVGGPFQSLKEAGNAIDRYLDDRWDPAMCLEQHEGPQVGKAHVDYAIRKCIFWPDGTRKKRLKSQPIDESRCWMYQLVKALVDKYNEDHNLLGDLAYELKALVCYQTIWEGRDSYYHINFTTKTKGAYGFDRVIDDLFFAEVTHMPGEHEKMVVSCICIVNPFDNGRCYGCKNNMKHPKADAYIGGHLDGGHGPCFPFGGPDKDWGETADDLKAEEAWLRHLYKGLDDPCVVERLMAPITLKFPDSDED